MYYLSFQEEVLVNTTDQKLGFGGYVAQVLLKAAGPGLKQECDRVQNPIPIGDVVTTGAHNLQSRHVIHVVLPRYDGANSELVSEKIINTIHSHIQCTCMYNYVQKALNHYYY